MRKQRGVPIEGVCQHDGIVMILQSIHQPVLVVRRFDGNDLEPLAERLYAFQDGRQSFPEQLLVAPIRDNIHHVVAMQIDGQIDNMCPSRQYLTEIYIIFRANEVVQLCIK